MPQPSYPISVKSWTDRKVKNVLKLFRILPYYYFCSIKYAYYAVAYKDLLHSSNTQIYQQPTVNNFTIGQVKSVVCSKQYTILSSSVFSYFTGKKKSLRNAEN